MHRILTPSERVKEKMAASFNMNMTLWDPLISVSFCYTFKLKR